MKIITVTTIALLFCSFLIAEEINWQVISGGGVESSTIEYFLSGTISQTSVGVSSDGANIINHGYWQFFCDCSPGDATNNGVVNILDITYLIAYLYTEGPPPAPYEKCSGDPNCDCAVNILDITYLIAYLYADGSSPCGCHNWLNNCEQPLEK